MNNISSAYSTIVRPLRQNHLGDPPPDSGGEGASLLLLTFCFSSGQQCCTVPGFCIEL